MRKETKSAASSRIGKALAALLLTTALLQSGSARGGSHSGNGFQGGGGFHGGFHGGGRVQNGGGFHGSGFHGGIGGFHGGGFHRHGFRGRVGVVIAPAIGGTWLGAGLSWPYYSYPDQSYYGYGPYSEYWYCANPEGFYPYIQQCNTGWQTVPAN